MGEVVQFIPRANPNRDVLGRINGVPAISYSEYDPRDPNISLHRQALEIFAQLGGPITLTDHLDDPKESA